MDCSDLIFLDGRVEFPDGTGTDGGSQPNCFGAGRGGITVHGPLSYFGGGTQDIVKLSSQANGSGGVVLACNPAVTDYEPLNLRGETITLQYRIPDPDNPNGPSTMSLPGLSLDEHGNVNIVNGLCACYFISDSAGHGYRFNNADNSLNLVTIEEDGRVRIRAQAGVGKRVAYFDADGYLCV